MSNLIDVIIKAIREKKGEDIVVIDLTDLEVAVCDYFIVCQGESPWQRKAIGEAIEQEVAEQLQDEPWNTEGYDGLNWILLDYVDVVVHIFEEEKRTFYNLEELWKDAEIYEYQEA